jgi:hypothetical protein
MRKVYNFIKETITSELEANIAITFNDRVCIFWNYIEQGEQEGQDIEGLNFKIDYRDM